MKRLAHRAIDVLIVTFIVAAVLSTLDESAKQQEATQRKMDEKRAADARAVTWRDLDEAGCRMTACERIGKR